MIPSKTIFSRYFDIFAASDFDYTKIGHRVEIPKFSRLILSNLLNQSKEKFQKESTLLRIDGEVLIIGDLHGNILDLLRILNAHFYTHDKFLFIGDFVDRGDFSIEVISLLLALTIEHPTRFFLIRGNHEFQEINRKYGFYDEIMTEYKDESLFNKFNDVFNYLPIAAIVNSVNFCVHGGIAETLKNVSQIERLERPIVDFSKQMIRDMMWSDPFDSDSSMYGIGERGKGCCYSYIACRIFFNDNPPLQKIIRGHECVNHGIKLSCSNKVITVFSSSNYSNIRNNLCGILEISADNEYKKLTFEPVNHLKKGESRIQIVESIPLIRSKQSFSSIKDFRGKNMPMAVYARQVFSSRIRPMVLSKSRVSSQKDLLNIESFGVNKPSVFSVNSP